MNYLKIKRLLDVIFSITGIIVLFPIILITAIAIKLESKGPIIFSQKRLGLNGKIFNIYKFRSMRVGAEKSGVYEMKNDTRVTKIGKIIRKTSIDELPQFINILKGEMSIIGPRPTLTYHPYNIDEYTIYQKNRFNVRPGVTGLAQVSGRKEILWDKRIEFDIEYVKSLSFLVDLKIFLRTIFRVLLMKDNLNKEKTAKVNINKDAA